MKLIKLILISAVVLFIVIVAFSLLLPSHVRVSRAINISGSREDILPYVEDLQQWRKWNRFILVADSARELEIVSDSLLKAGILEIRMLAKAIDTIETRWKQSNAKVSPSYFALMPGEHYTVVQWYFDFHLNWYPWQKFQSIIYDKQLGPYMEGSLQNLKRLVEQSK